MLIRNQQKFKTYSISAIMNNKKLASMMGEALKSPFGSSKRESARAVLRSITKTKLNDGRGGYPDLTVTDKPVTNTSLNNAYNLQGSPVMPSVATGAQPQSAVSPFMFPSAPAKKTTETTIPAMPVNNTSGVTGEFTVPEYGDTNSYDTWYNSLPDTEKTQWKPLYEAYKAGIGSSTFAQQLMGDRTKLKQMFPGVPDESLPDGASLANQVNDLDKTLQTKYQLETKESSLKNMQKEGLTMTSDLQDYMTSRDEYITKLDDLINRTKQSMTTMDIANPYVNQKLTKYLNYLNVLRGRQQKRYADFLSDAITEYNNKIKLAQDDYTDTYNRYSNELKSATNLTTEEYNTWKKLLEDLYNNVSGQEKEQYEMEKLYYDVNKSKYDAAKAAVDASNGGDPMSYSAWAVSAGVAGKPEYQVNDLMYVDTPPQWFRNEQNEKALGKSIGEDEMLLLWQQAKDNLKNAASSNGVSASKILEEIDWASQFIASQFDKVRANPDNAALVIRANCPNLTEADITNVMGKYGFSKSMGNWQANKFDINTINKNLEEWKLPATPNQSANINNQNTNEDKWSVPLTY